MLLTVIGAKTYGLLRSLLAPTLPQDKPYDELVTQLKSHFSPKPIVISERFQFYSRKQRANESGAEFLADLRKLTIMSLANFLSKPCGTGWYAGCTVKQSRDGSLPRSRLPLLKHWILP